MKQSRLGRWGEEYAQRYLEGKGYQIIARNWRTRDGEIDLIALKEMTLVFIEVKTRRSCSFGTGEESINLQKQARLAQLAQSYLDTQLNLQYSACRFDVIVIDLTQKPVQVRHYENAFYPS